MYVYEYMQVETFYNVFIYVIYKYKVHKNIHIMYSK